MKKLIYGIGLWFSYAASASPVQVACTGTGAAADRFVYQVHFSSSIEEGRGEFHLTAEGRGPGGQYDGDHRFNTIPYAFRVVNDPRGRPVETKIAGEALPYRGSLGITLNLSQPRSEAELQFARKDGAKVFAQLSCTTTLPEVCQTKRKCWNHCYPKIECRRICQNETTCERGKFANEN